MPLLRFIANILLPVLLFGGGYLLFHWLGRGVVDAFELQVMAISLAALLAALPPVAFSYIIQSQIREGFALLRGGAIATPNEITLNDVLTHRITAWKPFRQHLTTEVCLQGEGELLYVTLGFDFTIPANEGGKRFVQHFAHNMTVFEAWVQRSIYEASCHDREMAANLDEATLLNEEDERILRHKFIYALRAQPLRSLQLPTSSRDIHLRREIRRREKVPGPGEQLDLDTLLLQQLGLHAPG
jgi:hypothetical protein